MTHAPVPGPPSVIPAAGPASDLDRTVAELAVSLSELPLAEHHDRLAQIHEFLHGALDEVRAVR